MHVRPALGLLTSVLALFIPLTAIAGSHRAAILGMKSLAIVDLDSAAIVNKVALPISATQMLMTPDNARIVVLGAGDESQGRKSSMAVVDLATMKLIASSDLGWGIADAAFSGNETLYLLTSGSQSSKTKDQRPAELLAIDTTTGTIAKRISFSRRADAFGLVGDPKKLAVFFRPAQNLPAELRLVDPGSVRETATVALRGNPAPPVAIPGASFLYSIDSAKNGGVEVVSIADGVVAATLDVGEEPKLGAVDSDGRRLFVLSAKDNVGMVSLVRDKTVDASIPVAAYQPTEAQISSDGKWLFLGGEKFKRHWGFREVAVSRIDLSTNTAGPVAETTALYPREFAVTRDAGTMVMFNGGEKSCCTLTINDLVAGKQKTIMETGSRGKRVAAGLLAAGLTVASFSAAHGAAHGGSFFYSIYTPRSGYARTRGPLTLSADGKFAYVLDPATDFLTVADIEQGKKVANFGVGSGVKELVMLGGGKTLAVVCQDSVVLVDTSTNQKKDEITGIGGIEAPAVSPDGSQAIISGHTKVFLLAGDGTRRQIPDLVYAAQVIFLE